MVHTGLSRHFMFDLSRTDEEAWFNTDEAAAVHFCCKKVHGAALGTVQVLGSSLGPFILRRMYQSILLAMQTDIV